VSADGPGRREVAHRLFAAEFDDATVSYAESDEERAPKYVVTPTGARVNRLFAVGVLTEVESVNEDVLRARVVDPTGAFVSYAGQYQPDAAAFFERADPPTFVALTGKARTFEPEDGDRIYTSVRPESVGEVDADTRDRWTVSAAEATLRRVAAMAEARALDARGDDLRDELLGRGYDESLAAGIPIALDRYGTTVAYLDAVRELALDALAVVAGDADAVRSLDVAPDDAGTTALGPMPEGMGGDSIPATPADTGTTESTATTKTTVDGKTADAETSDDATTEAEGDAGERAEADADADGDPPASDGAAEDIEADTTTDADAATTGEEDDLGDFEEDDLYELDEEERKEVESEFDVGFESAAEVDDPGEADIDVPGPEDVEEAADAEGDEAPTEASDEGDPDTDADDEASDLDLESLVVETMDELDDGDGADREAVVAAVVDDHGADPGAVEDAIEDALMSGRCYEPGEDRLKAI
jgi:RPA family protein